MPITPNSEMQAQYSQAFRKSLISPRLRMKKKLLVNLWEDEFEAFLNKKRVKQEDWDALTEMYNSHAVVMKLSRHTSTQLESKIKNL